MADYQIQPQFANLANIRPLSALDVTRGGALEFRPLQRIEIPSARPELVAQGIASALSNIGTSAFGAISAKYQAEKELDKEARKYQHELDVARIKKQGEETPEQKDTRALELFKSKREYLEKHPLPSKEPKKYDQYGNEISQADQNIINARLATVPSGALSKEPDTEDELPIDGDVLKDEDNVLFSNKQTNNVDLNAPVDVMQGMSQSTTAQYIPEQKVPQERAEAIAKAVTEQQPLISTQPSDLSVSTGAGPVGVINQPALELSLTGLKPLLTEEQQANLDVQKQALYGLKPVDQVSVTAPQQPIQTIEIGRYTPKTEQEEKEILQKARNLPENTKFEKEEIGTPKRVSYVVKPLTPDELNEKQTKKTEQEIKIAESKEKQETSELNRQVKQQKVKDAPKLLFDAADEVATTLRSVNRALELLDQGGVTGLYGTAMSSFPGTNAGEFSENINQIIAKKTLGSLTKLREASPTGGALGNVSNQDTGLLKDAAGVLSQFYTKPEVLKQRLEEYKNGLEQTFENVTKDDNWNFDKYKIPSTVFGETKKEKPSEIPIVTNKSDYDKLPSGSKYIFKGKELTKK